MEGFKLVSEVVPDFEGLIVKVKVGNIVKMLMTVVFKKSIQNMKMMTRWNMKTWVLIIFRF